MEETWFKDWFNTSYYHTLYKNRDYTEAANFIDKLIKFLSPPQGAKVLDIACGKGRHAIQLAEKGYDVTGVDLSEESIEEALRFESDTLHFFTHDMRQPFWINYFDFAFNFFTSFGYFETNRENENAIRSIAQSLQKNGIFVMDYLNIAYVERNMTHQEVKTIDDIQFTITKWYDDNFFYKKIIIDDSKKETPQIYTEKVARFTLKNFEKLFENQGMEIIKTFGEYNLSEYIEKDSSRLIMIAKKIH